VEREAVVVVETEEAFIRRPEGPIRGRPPIRPSNRPSSGASSNGNQQQSHGRPPTAAAAQSFRRLRARGCEAAAAGPDPPPTRSAVFDQPSTSTAVREHQYGNRSGSTAARRPRPR